MELHCIVYTLCGAIGTKTSFSATQETSRFSRSHKSESEGFADTRSVWQNHGYEMMLQTNILVISEIPKTLNVLKTFEYSGFGEPGRPNTNQDIIKYEPLIHISNYVITC